MTVNIKDLVFSYPGAGARKIFSGLSLELPPRARALVVGANGVGKSTLLRIIAGQHLVPNGRQPEPAQQGVLCVLGRRPFEDLSLSRDVALVDGDFPVYVDLSVEELIRYGRGSVDPRRERELMEILEINPAWRMCRTSEGQRRRVQMLLALRNNIKLLLIDEVTSHLDVVSRWAFLDWLKRENEKHGLAVLYATHIFDGLSGWPTHYVFIDKKGGAAVRETGGAGCAFAAGCASAAGGDPGALVRWGILRNSI